MVAASSPSHTSIKDKKFVNCCKNKRKKEKFPVVILSSFRQFGESFYNFIQCSSSPLDSSSGTTYNKSVDSDKLSPERFTLSPLRIFSYLLCCSLCFSRLFTRAKHSYALARAKSLPELLRGTYLDSFFLWKPNHLQINQPILHWFSWEIGRGNILVGFPASSGKSSTGGTCITYFWFFLDSVALAISCNFSLVERLHLLTRKIN